MKTINRFIDVLLVKNIHWFIFDYKNFSLSSIKIVDNLSKYLPEINSIIDIGANRGQFLFAINKIYPSAYIHSFEPLPELFEILKTKVASNEKITVHNLAISKEEGDISFFRGDYSHISSVLKINIDNDNPKYKTAEVTEIKVPSIPLETFFRGNSLSRPILLKIDAQGLEMEILKSLGSSSSQVDFIVLELAFVQLYEKQALFTEVNQFLNLIGFSIVAPVDFNRGLHGKIIEMDVLYKNNVI